MCVVRAPTGISTIKLYYTNKYEDIIWTSVCVKYLVFMQVCLTGGVGARSFAGRLLAALILIITVLAVIVGHLNNWHLHTCT